MHTRPAGYVVPALQPRLGEVGAERPDARAAGRAVLWKTGRVCSNKSEKLPEGKGNEYKDYFQFSESARQIPPHRILALNRAEKEGALKVRLEWSNEAVHQVALTAVAEGALRQGTKLAEAAQAQAAVTPPE